MTVMCVLNFIKQLEQSLKMSQFLVYRPANQVAFVEERVMHLQRTSKITHQRLSLVL